ncbi:MAG: patatin-like phospholipase family protein [Myxococcota bacterium]
MTAIHQASLDERDAPDLSDGDRRELLRFRAADGSIFLPEAELQEARRRGLELRLLRTLEADEIPVRFVLPHDGAVCNLPPADARAAVLARLLSEDRADGDEHIRFLGRNRSVPPDAFVLDRAFGRRAYVWQIVPQEELEAPCHLRDRFPALERLFRDPETRVVLSLGSGGLKLFAHAILLRFLEAVGCSRHIDEIWGSSGGAVAGLLYCMGLSAQAIEQTGYDLYSGRYTLPLRPSRIQVLRQVLRDTLFSDPGESGFCDGGGPLGRMLERYCSRVRPRRPFYSVAFNLAECRTQVLTEEPVPPHLDGLMVRTDAREAALASSAVPLLFLPRRILQGGRETPYIDGSTTEDVPLHSVVTKWDRDRSAGVETRRRLVILYSKLTGSLDQYRTRSGRIGKLRMLQLVASAGVETMHLRDVELLRRREDVELLGVELADMGVDLFEVDRVPRFLRMAKEGFPRQLEAIEERLAARERTSSVLPSRARAAGAGEGRLES